MGHDPRMENLALCSCKYPFIFLHYFPSLFITAMVLFVSGNTNVFYDLRLGILVCLMFALIFLGFNLMFLSVWGELCSCTLGSGESIPFLLSFLFLYESFKAAGFYSPIFSSVVSRVAASCYCQFCPYGIF